MTITSRAEAKAQGLTRYFTGKPCSKGHVVERRTSNYQCVECGKAGVKAWYVANPECKKATIKAWRLTNAEREKAQHREYRLANLEREKARSREYRLANLERIRVRKKAEHLANPEAWKASQHRRRARKKRAEGSFTKQDILGLLAEQEGLCLCGADIRLDYTIDHVVPLARGGSNWPSNLQLLCQPCNDSKGTKLMHEWKPELSEGRLGNGEAT